MSGVTDREEMLERLWQLGERGGATRESLRASLKGRFVEKDLEMLVGDGCAVVAGETVTLSPEGTRQAERLIRAHRIGERLIHDVMGREFESGACEFEHIPATDIVDGICTLLGHPRECPHGFPIPEGECCRASARWVQQVVVPLTELRVGQSARVAWVYTRSDQQLHRLTSLQIRPGSTVKLHQVSPSWVIECDGASIAMDGEVAKNISVWLEGSPAVVPGRDEPNRAPRPVFTRPRWGWRFRSRSRS
jgi:DtxR family Mn-dependent transcriptional regulator